MIVAKPKLGKSQMISISTSRELSDGASWLGTAYSRRFGRLVISVRRRARDVPVDGFSNAGIAYPEIGGASRRFRLVYPTSISFGTWDSKLGMDRRGYQGATSRG